MNPSREKSLFDQALDLPSGEREAFVRHECDADAALCERVLALLAAHEVTTAFLPGQPRLISSEPDDFAGELPGDLIGRYKLLERVGEGGCGVVYVAEQTEPVRRRVALKVIKLGMDTKAVVARFEAERQALAMMDHPNIAKVFDAGATDRGRPYFVMELVRGIPITHYCDQNSLGTQARLGLFIQVCHAIQHAHQKGIIHRDIKPSNILVTVNDGVPVPKVIDFGIAKATEGKLSDATVYTQLHQFIGTPAYMSPEQAEMTSLDIDTRSDIYSLGVLLYELLAGRTPFDARELLAAGLDAMRRTIREQEPARPSTKLATLQGNELSTTAKRRATEPPQLVRELQGDLDWIVMKCLEKDRTRRYETANGLAADLNRHLTHEPVVARPPSTGYRLHKAFQRNRAAFAVTALFALVLLTATAFSLWQATVARDSATESQAIAKYMIEVFRSPDPTKDGRTVTVLETLDRAVKKLETELHGQEPRKIRLQEAFANTYFGLMLHREELPLREKIREFHLRESGPEHPATIMATIQLALCELNNEKGGEQAVKLMEETLALSTRVSGRKSTNSLAAMEVLVRSYRGGRDPRELELAQELFDSSTDVKGSDHPDTVRALGLLAIAQNNRKNLPEAIKLHEQAVALNQRVNGDKHPDTLVALINLAFLYGNADRYDEAVTLMERAVPLIREVHGPEHRLAYDMTSALGSYYLRGGQRDKNLRVCLDQLESVRTRKGSESVETVQATRLASNAYLFVSVTPEAVQLQEELLRLERKLNGPESRETLGALYRLGTFHLKVGRTNEGVVHIEEAVLLNRRLHGRSKDYAGYLISIASSLVEAGQFKRAIPHLKEAVPLCREFFPVDEHLGYSDELGIPLESPVIKAYAGAGRTIEGLQTLKPPPGEKPWVRETRTAVLVGALQFWVGDLSGYIVTRDDLLSRLTHVTNAPTASSGDMQTAELAAKLASVQPEAPAAVQAAALVLARKAVEWGAEKPHLAWYRLALGMAELRAGNLAAADAELEAAARDPAVKPSWDHDQLASVAGFYHAISLHQQGKADAARQRFAAAEARMKPLPKDEKNPLQGGGDRDSLFCWLAHREAKALLQPPGTGR